MFILQLFQEPFKTFFSRQKPFKNLFFQYKNLLEKPFFRVTVAGKPVLINILVPIPGCFNLSKFYKDHSKLKLRYCFSSLCSSIQRIQKILKKTIFFFSGQNHYMVGKHIRKLQQSCTTKATLLTLFLALNHDA